MHWRSSVSSQGARKVRTNKQQSLRPYQRVRMCRVKPTDLRKMSGAPLLRNGTQQLALAFSSAPKTLNKSLRVKVWSQGGRAGGWKVLPDGANSGWRFYHSAAVWSARYDWPLWPLRPTTCFPQSCILVGSWKTKATNISQQRALLISWALWSTTAAVSECFC